MGSPEGEVGRYRNEGPRHLVQLSKGFWLAETPCTQEFWLAVARTSPRISRSPQEPVEEVSWDDCTAFLGVIIKETKVSSLRLPTEVEWEYACRAGTETATWAGDLRRIQASQLAVLDEIAWYSENSGYGVRDVCRKRPNPWGLRDMLGNVYEWCGDRGQIYSSEMVTDPGGQSRGSHRVCRGGSWRSSVRRLRAASRIRSPPSARILGLGFRLALGTEGGERPAKPGAAAGRLPGVGRARDEPGPPDAAPDGGRR